MRAGTTSQILAATVILASAGGFVATRLMAANGRALPGDRRIEAPLAIRHSFRRFSDSAGAGLLDTLFKLGYHGGNSWDEKTGAVRPNLVAETDSGSVADSAAGIYEGVISLDLHHDDNTDIPPSISMRFANTRKTGRWVLLTTDGLPEDPSDDLPIEKLRTLPRDLHDAITTSFGDRADAFTFWKSLEGSNGQAPASAVH